MNWFAEVFSDNSSLAKLVTIVISSAVAVCVVLLNNWIQSSRARKDLLIKKIEELFIASKENIRSIEEMTNLIQDTSKGKRIDIDSLPKETIQKFEESLAKVEMLVSLYFPKEEFNPLSYHISRYPIVSAVNERAEIDESEYSSMLYKTLTNIMENKDSLNGLYRRVLKKYGA